MRLYFHRQHSLLPNQSAATAASACPGPLRDFYANLLTKGMRPEMARLTLARKIAAIIDYLEERRTLRSRATKNTSSLSAQRLDRLTHPDQSLSARVRG